MEQNQAFTEFVKQLKPGQVYKALGYDIVVIIDVLQSSFTENVALYVRFVRNIGNARQYDILELSPDKHLGVLGWEQVTVEELRQAINKREEIIRDELDKLVYFTEYG